MIFTLPATLIVGGNTFKLAFEIGIHDTIGIDLVNIILAKKKQ